MSARDGTEACGNRPVAEFDAWVRLPPGRLYTRSWQPAAAHGAPDAAAILLFHDSLGCVALWRDFPARLAQATGRRVVAYDRLGFGRSDPRPGPLPPDFIAEEAATAVPALRAQLGIGRFVAMGHSVGGGMAVHAAAAHAADCEALVTVAAQAFVEDRTRAGIVAAREQFADPAQVERLARHHGDKARGVLDAWIETWLHPDFASWALAPVLPRVACPVLALHGELDEYGSSRHPETIARLAGRPGRAVLLPGVGHVPHREQPARVLALVAEFLDAAAAR